MTKVSPGAAPIQTPTPEKGFFLVAHGLLITSAIQLVAAGFGYVSIQLLQHYGFYDAQFGYGFVGAIVTGTVFFILEIVSIFLAIRNIRGSMKRHVSPDILALSLFAVNTVMALGVIWVHAF